MGSSSPTDVAIAIAPFRELRVICKFNYSSFIITICVAIAIAPFRELRVYKNFLPPLVLPLVAIAIAPFRELRVLLDREGDAEGAGVGSNCYSSIQGIESSLSALNVSISFIPVAIAIAPFRELRECHRYHPLTSPSSA